LALDDQANEIQQDRMLAAFAVAENGDNSEGAPRGHRALSRGTPDTYDPLC